MIGGKRTLRIIHSDDRPCLPRRRLRVAIIGGWRAFPRWRPWTCPRPRRRCAVPAAASTSAAGCSAPAATSAPSSIASRCGLLITPSAAFKGELAPEHIARDGRARRVVRGGAPGARPSAEALLHVEIVRVARRRRGAAHAFDLEHARVGRLRRRRRRSRSTATRCSRASTACTTHEHREWLPIVENDQDMPRLAAVVARRAVVASGGARRSCFAVMASTRGARTCATRVRHVEILEFLMEVIARRARGQRSRALTISERATHGRREDSG